MICDESAASLDFLDRLAEKIEAEMGLSYPAAKLRDLVNAVHRMAEAKGFDQDDACIDWLLRGQWDKEKTDLCAHYLTIGETYFFREPRAFELVCNYARQKMNNPAGANTPLRIWSAGCCTGEEPYSIAMALRHAVPELDPDMVSILATDVNSRNLQFARDGIYRQWSFRSANAAMLKDLNFSENGEGQFRIGERIRKQVKFAELNLAQPIYPSASTDTEAIDIIFCRNVLMYFSGMQARKVIERFRHCLVDGGWLIVSPSEASAELFSGFSRTYYPDGIYFQKDNRSERSLFLPFAVPDGDPPDVGASAVGLDAESSNAALALKLGPAARALPAVRPRKEKGKEPDKPDAFRDAVATASAVISHARALANQGEPGKAMQFLERAIETGPPAVDLYHAKALIAMESGDSRAAMQSLKRILYLKPDFILAHYLMGVLQSAQNRHAEAVRRFETTNGLLAALGDDEVVPGSEGLSAAYFRESVRSYLQKDSL